MKRRKPVSCYFRDTGEVELRLQGDPMFDQIEGWLQVYLKYLETLFPVEDIEAMSLDTGRYITGQKKQEDGSWTWRLG